MAFSPFNTPGSLRKKPWYFGLFLCTIALVPKAVK